jgi:hypothetical protein
MDGKIEMTFPILWSTQEESVGGRIDLHSEQPTMEQTASMPLVANKMGLGGYIVKSYFSDIFLCL